MTIKTGDIKQWKEIGQKTKEVRDKLFELRRASNYLLPKSILKEIDKSLNTLDIFRDKAEDRMFNINGKDADIHVFYGDD